MAINSTTDINLALLQLGKNANEYKQKREVEYPEIVDQLDDIYHNGIEGWKTKIKTIKDKYPKP